MLHKALNSSMFYSFRGHKNFEGSLDTGLMGNNFVVTSIRCMLILAVRKTLSKYYNNVMSTEAKDKDQQSI